MFTGIIETTLELLETQSLEAGVRLRFSSPWTDIQAGESIAINGVCLTALEDGGKDVSFDLSPETLDKTTFKELKLGDVFNAERALKVGDRLGGHYVSGHIDGTACVRLIEQRKDFIELQLHDFDDQQARMFLIEKGSITVDGASLTINSVDSTTDRISLMLVPHTLAVTTLDKLSPGKRVNIEFDNLSKIVAHQMKEVYNTLFRDH